MSGRFRKQYRKLTAEEQGLVQTIKAFAEQLENEIEDVPDPRHKALALTKLEESVMWAVKGITG